MESLANLHLWLLDPRDGNSGFKGTAICLGPVKGPAGLAPFVFCLLSLSVFGWRT